MGLLDDAIREHLDLKRRRGADPAEVARAEQEALGPARREPDASPDRAAGQADPAPAASDEPAPPSEPPAEEHREPDPPPAAAAPGAGADPILQPTTEFNVEDHGDEPEAHGVLEPDAVGDGPDHDVLDETPDFLQETPEHDRLWFEQRPPRDFDFDG
jgi:hypothetical protein